MIVVRRTALLSFGIAERSWLAPCLERCVGCGETADVTDQDVAGHWLKGTRVVVLAPVGSAV